MKSWRPFASGSVEIKVTDRDVTLRVLNERFKFLESDVETDTVRVRGQRTVNVRYYPEALVDVTGELEFEAAGEAGTMRAAFQCTVVSEKLNVSPTCAVVGTPLARGGADFKSSGPVELKNTGPTDCKVRISVRPPRPELRPEIRFADDKNLVTSLTLTRGKSRELFVNVCPTDAATVGPFCIEVRTAAHFACSITVLTAAHCARSALSNRTVCTILTTGACCGSDHSRSASWVRSRPRVTSTRPFSAGASSRPLLC